MKGWTGAGGREQMSRRHHLIIRGRAGMRPPHHTKYSPLNQSTQELHPNPLYIRPYQPILHLDLD